ncbi:MAG: DUF1778 domain-containing protein [Thiothrix sp.]|nr:MAG: DUF1778 domain-containing protein [Thiothrix sp.]
MQTRDSTRDTPINIRALPAQRALIDRAASMLGKKRSDFMLEVVCREAMDVLLDQRLFLLDEAQFNAFNAALEQPLTLEQQTKITKLLNTPAPWDH